MLLHEQNAFQEFQTASCLLQDEIDTEANNNSLYLATSIPNSVYMNFSANVVEYFMPDVDRKGVPVTKMR